MYTKFEVSKPFQRYLSNRRLADVIYFDFFKAFDYVSHSKLIYKLTAYGLAGRLLEVMTAFFIL